MPEWVMRIGPYTLTFNRPDPPSAEEVQRLVDTNGELLAQMPLSYILSRGLSVPRTKLPNGEYVADVMKSRSPYEQYRYVQSLQKRTPAQEAFLVAYKKRVIDAGYEPFARDEWKYIYSRTKYAGNPELEAKRQALEKAFRSDAFLRGVAMQSRNLRLAREVENFEQRNRYALQLASQLSELDKNLRGGLRGIWTAYTQIVPSLPMAAVRAHEEAARNAARGGKLSIAEQAKYAGLGVAGTSAQMLLDPVMQLGAVGALVGVPALARGVKAATTAGMLARGAPAVEAGVAGQRAGAIASGLAHGGLGLGFGIPMMYHAWQALRQPTDLVSEKAGAFASGLMGAGMAAGGAVAGVRGMRAPAARPEAVFVARSTVESLRRGDRLAGELIGGGEPAVVRSVSDTSVEVVRRGPNHTLETKTIPKKQLVKRMAEVLDTGLMSVDELRVQRRQPTTRAEASPEAQPQPQPVPEQPPAQPAPEQRQSVAPEVVTQAAPDTQPVAPQPQPTPRMLPDVGTGDHPSISLAGIGEVRRGDTLSRVLFDGDSDVLVTRITDTHVIGSKTGGDGATVAIPLDVLEARVVAQLAPGMSTPEQLRVRPTEPPAEVPPQQSVSQPPVEPVAVPEPVRPTEPATPVQRQVAQSVPVLPVAQDVVPQPPPVEVAPAPVAPAPAPSPKPRRARGSKKAAEQPTAETPVAQPVPEAIPVEQPVKAAQAAQPPAEAPAPAKRRTSRGKKAAEPQVETAADAVAAQPAAPEPPVQASSPAATLREKAAEAHATETKTEARRTHETQRRTEASPAAGSSGFTKEMKQYISTALRQWLRENAPEFAEVRVTNNKAMDRLAKEVEVEEPIVLTIPGDGVYTIKSGNLLAQFLRVAEGPEPPDFVFDVPHVRKAPPASEARKRLEIVEVELPDGQVREYVTRVGDYTPGIPSEAKVLSVKPLPEASALQPVKRTSDTSGIGNDIYGGPDRSGAPVVSDGYLVLSLDGARTIPEQLTKPAKGHAKTYEPQKEYLDIVASRELIDAQPVAEFASYPSSTRLKSAATKMHSYVLFESVDGRYKVAVHKSNFNAIERAFPEGRYAFDVQGETPNVVVVKIVEGKPKAAAGAESVPLPPDAEIAAFKASRQAQASSPAAALREKAAEARAAAEELAQQQAQRGGVRGKGSRRSTGAVLGPEDIAMRIKEAALRIYAGTLDAAAWFSEMTHKYGEAVRPHLDRWWRRAQEIARAMRKREFGNQQEAEAFAADRARRTRKLPQVEYTEPQQGRMVNDPDVARALDEIAEAYGAEVLSAGRTRVTAELARREGVPWSGHAPEYKSMGEFMGAAKRRVDADPELPVRIAQRVQRASGGKPVTAEEQAALVYGMARSTSRLRELAREAERTTDPAQLRRLGDEMARERATLELLYEANAKVGTEAARAFNIRKLMVLADDRSVIINRMRAEAGRPLRPEEVARAEQLADELRRTRDELEQIRQANADAVRRAEEAQQRAEALRAEVLRLRRQAVSQGAVQPVQAPPSQAAQPASVRQTAQASRAVARAEARTEARVRRETVRAQRIAQLQAEREAAKQAMMDAFRTALRGTPPSAMGVGVFQGFTPEVLHQIAANAAKYAAAYVKETGLKVADAYDLLASEVSAQFNIALSGKELSSLVRKHKLLVRRAEALTQALERIRQQEEAGTLTGTASERILGKLNQVLTALNMKPVSADVTPQQLQRVRAKLREIASALSETPLDAEARASLAALEAEIAQFEAAEVVVTHMQRQRQALEQRRQRLQDAIDRQVRGEQTTEGGRRRRRAQEPEDIREARRQVRELEQELRDLQEFERAREPLRQTLEQLRQLRRDTSRPRAERYAEGRRIVEELVREYPVLRRAGREATQLLGQSPELIEAHMAHNAAVRAVEAELYRMRAPSLQQVLWEIFNCSRAIRQSFDLSAVGKQQAIVFLTHPFTASRQMMPMLRAMASQRAYERIQAHIASDPEIAQAVAAGLQITDVAPQAAALGIREEGFYSVYAEKIPGVLQSERAFIVMNNLVRSELWKLYSRAINARLQRRRGRTMNEDEMRDLAEWVNTISGRATFSERVQKRWGAVLGTVFWAPRLLLARSRLFNPAYFIKVARRSPEVGRIMFMEMAKLYAALSAIMTAAKYAGATVHDDPKDGRFGYITVGKTNIDLTGGARTVASLLFRTMNAIKEAHEQKLEGTTRARKIFYPASRFVRSKASPIGGILWDIYTGTTFEGEPVSAKSVLTSMAVPLSAVDAYEAYKAYAKEEHGLAKTVAASAAAVTGAANTRVWATRPTSGTRVRTRRARRRRPRAVMQVSF